MSFVDKFDTQIQCEEFAWDIPDDLKFGIPEPEPKKQKDIIRRIVPLTETNAKIYSWTRGVGITHYLHIDPETGFASCTCEDFIYRKQKQGYVCKHLQRYFAYRIRKVKRGSK